MIRFSFFLYYVIGLWSIITFFALLYLKYFLSERKMLRTVPKQIPSGWKSPFADADDGELLARLKAISGREENP